VKTRSAVVLAAVLLLAPAGALSSARAQYGVSLSFDGSFPEDIEETAQLRVSTEDSDTYFYMLLTNRGEVGDTFDIYAEGAPGGWAAVLNVTVVDLPAFQTQPIAMVVSSPQSLSGGLQSWAVIMVAARSRSDPTCTTHLHTLTVLDTTIGPALVGFAGPGQAAQFPLTLRNTGTDSDTITVDAAYVHSEPRLDTHQPWETHAPGGWQCSVAPVAFTLPGGGQAQAMLKLTAPADSAKGDYQILNLTARSGSDPTKTQRLTAITIVSIRYGVRLDCAERTKKALGGEPARFLVNVTNNGTMRDVVSLSTEPAPYGWTAILGAASFVLNSGESRQVGLDVTPPVTAPANSTGTVRVIGRSGGNQSMSGWVDTFTIANPDFLLRFNGTQSVRYVDPGNTTTHTLEIRNLGAEDDAALLDLSGPTGNWTAGLGAASVLVPARTSAFVFLDVSAPADALAGETLDLLVRCRSLHDPADSAELLARTVANRTRKLTAELSPPVLSAYPEEAAPFMLSVRNGGNADEAVSFSAGRLPPNWTMAFNESLLLVGPRSSRQLLCTVTPDFSAAARDHPVSAVVLAEGLSAEACATVSVKKAFRFVLECNDHEKKAPPGGKAEYNVTVINRGNADDIVLVQLIVDDPVPALNWSVGEPSVRVPVGGRAIIPVNLTAAPRTFGGVRGSCRVRGVSSGNSSFWRELELGGTVAVESGLGLAQAPVSAEVMPGETAVFSLTLDNLGNVGESVGLGLEGLPSGWNFTFKDASGQEVASFSLAPYASSSFRLALATPSGAPAGNYTVRAKFTTVSGMSISADSRVVVRQVYDLYFVAQRKSVTVRAGGIQTVGLVVRNLGNGPDEVSLSVLGSGGERWAGLNASGLSLAAGELAQPVLRLQPAREERNGIHHFEVRARSSSGLERNVTVEVRVVQDESLVTSEPPCLLAGAAVAVVGIVAMYLFWRNRRPRRAG